MNSYIFYNNVIMTLIKMKNTTKKHIFITPKFSGAQCRHTYPCPGQPLLCFLLLIHDMLPVVDSLQLLSTRVH
jgi:hypothetical protein